MNEQGARYQALAIEWFRDAEHADGFDAWLAEVGADFIGGFRSSATGTGE